MNKSINQSINPSIKTQDDIYFFLLTGGVGAIEKHDMQFES